jgi:hypothetical protein
MDAATLYMIVTLAEGTMRTEAFPQESVDYCLQAQENTPQVLFIDILGQPGLQHPTTR